MQVAEVEMEIFRAGDYGAKGSYSPADLDALARDYSPAVLEAPLTLDHAQSGPAYGWVTRLRADGGRLMACLRDVPEAVRQMVRGGAYRQRSIELVKSLRETGRPYLRAVTLLGAATPEVHGLSDVRFSARPEEIEAVAGVATVDEPLSPEPSCAQSAAPAPGLRPEVPLGEEAARATGSSADAVHFSVGGFPGNALAIDPRTDPASLELHWRAATYAEASGLPYGDALRHVARGAGHRP